MRVFLSSIAAATIAFAIAGVLMFASMLYVIPALAQTTTDEAATTTEEADNTTLQQQTTPSLPSAGEGGEAFATYAILVASLLVAGAGVAYMARTRSQ